MSQVSPDAVSDLRNRRSVGRRARRSDTNNRGKGGREEPGEVDERERNGECARGRSPGIKAQQE